MPPAPRFCLCPKTHCKEGVVAYQDLPDICQQNTITAASFDFIEKDSAVKAK
jgi:hypothetical protein